jgi:predicted nucleotidyltransferase
MTRSEIRSIIIPILKKYDIIKASLFGSIVRGEATEKSDIDILVEFKKGRTLLDLVGLKLELEDIFKKKVDVLTYNSINPRLKKYILKDQEILI